MWDVVSLGDLFVDLVPHSRVDGQWLYAPSPGGAPGNVAAGLAKLDHKVIMVSRVGADAFGRLLIEALSGYGVDVSGIIQSPTERAGLSIVTLDESGDRSFMFYHDRPADQHIRAEDIKVEWLVQSKILHVGILPLASPTSAAAQRRAMDLADANGLPISCDVNFRPSLWHREEDMLAAGREVISRSAIVKVSEEELQSVTGKDDLDAGIQAIWHERLEFFSITRGARGATLYTPNGTYDCAGFKVGAIDTTGSGDAYTAAVLSGVLNGIDPQRLLDMACAAGGLTATRKGAMKSLPTTAELAAFVESAGST
ncbi:MAG: carbohydrate kinase [Aestuariivirga sp.]|uniref:carbohydrate kinase family protein n=1 Tax=Aestuariivirga sp. TaxID=2650926 RepID=UPI0030199930